MVNHLFSFVPARIFGQVPGLLIAPLACRLPTVSILTRKDCGYNRGMQVLRI
jgi:hypothetical protein